MPRVYLCDRLKQDSSIREKIKTKPRSSLLPYIDIKNQANNHSPINLPFHFDKK